MKLVVAVDNEWGIGNKGDLLARIRADLINFKTLTDGHTVILGSNTLATFPGGKPLKNRVNIVLHPSPDYKPEGATVAHSVPEAVELANQSDPDGAFVIGGASIYRQILPYCDTAYVTKFKQSYEKDVWFENLDRSPEWALESESAPLKSDPENDTDPDLEFTYCVYKRVLPPVFVRKAADADAADIHRLLKVIAGVHRELRPDLFANVESKYSVPELHKMIADNGEKRIFVAESEGKVCGYIICWQEQDRVKTLYVDDLCVDPSYRRRGVAKKLMDAASKYGRETGCVFMLLNAWDGNKNAEEFYRSYGMTERSKYLEKKL